MNTQRMYWSVRRELWENRSIYVAPLAIAAVIVFGFLVSMLAAAQTHESAPDKLAQPYDFAAILIMATTLIVAVFCLDALRGERRDRSVLFWKSMPVSDLTTVLSKAAIPLVLLPLLTFVITVATQVIMLLLNRPAGTSGREGALQRSRTEGEEAIGPPAPSARHGAIRTSHEYRSANGIGYWFTAKGSAKSQG
jgi:ABC-2 type transport system permease protein